MNFTPVAKRLMAKRIKKLETAAQSPVETQVRQLRWLLFHGANSKFGKEADFESVLHLGDPRLAFSRLIPARDYETLRPSGTSGGRSKIIPITDHALRLNHYDGASDVVAFYLAANPASRLFAGKGLILGGSFEKPLPCSSITARAGDLSATLIDRIPGAASLFRTPSKETALMSDWSEKLDRIAREAAAERVTNLSGVPSWMLKVLERSLDISGKDSLAELWPDLETFFYGGISFLPYRGEYSRICGDKKLIFFPTYNASEGFFASASHLQRPGSADREEMTLLLDATIYYEFYPVGHTEPDGPLESDPVMIEDLKVGDTYELVITAPNGLYRYRLGDCVTVTDTAPVIEVVMEFIAATGHDPTDMLVLAQATSPFTKPDDFRSLRSAVEEKRADSYISCLRSKRFIWHSDGTPLSYRIDAKPLRQAFGGTLIETGAFYASTVGDITRSGRLLSGRIGIVETSPGTDIDIDEPIDWLKAEALAKAGTMIQ